MTKAFFLGGGLGLRWRYVSADFCIGRFWVPADVLNQEHLRRGNIDLHVEGLPLKSVETEDQNTYLRAIPSNLLVSLALDYSTPALTTRLDPLKQLLLSCPRLESLQYRDRGQGTRFTFLPSERLPAFKHLVLKCYDWTHSREEVAAHWDLSRIRSLVLISVPIYDFLCSISFADLADLHTLHLEDFSAHRSDRRIDATRKLHSLLRPGHIGYLEELRVTCHTTYFRPLDVLLAHATSLRLLSFRDHVGFADENIPCPTLHPAELALLSDRFFHLHTLELDLDTAACTDPDSFLRSVCNFPSLHTLYLHMQTVLRSGEDSPSRPSLGGTDPGWDSDSDHVAAMHTFDTLIHHKTGPVLWKSVTISIGGWVPGPMVRRLSEVWQERNRYGIYAERCFVMERVSTGELSVREEKGTGTTPQQ